MQIADVQNFEDSYFLAVQISGTMGTMFDSTVDNICIGCETKKPEQQKRFGKVCQKQE